MIHRSRQARIAGSRKMTRIVAIRHPTERIRQISRVAGSSKAKLSRPTAAVRIVAEVRIVCRLPR